MAENNDDRARWFVLQRKLAEHRILEIFKVFRREGIEPVLIKGWAAGLKYARPWERYFSDIDIAVNPDEYKKALEISEVNNLNVDLHEGLRHHDTLG
ncbi:MAG TPA: nucleotidyltransferase family protein, partial [Pyrinomonadaceae bacterium]